MASSALPWFGSTQYSPKSDQDERITQKAVALLSPCSSVKPTALLHGVASLQVVTGPGRVLPAAVGALHALKLAAEGL